jgi:amino acid permease
VGAGSFVLPFCMRQMGLVPGILTIVLLGVVCVYTTLMLVRTKDMLYKTTGKRDVTYVDIGTALPPPLSRFSLTHTLLAPPSPAVAAARDV